MMSIRGQILNGQVLLIICFIIYPVWWYRGFLPGCAVSRVKSFNGLLLLVTAVAGIAVYVALLLMSR